MFQTVLFCLSFLDCLDALPSTAQSLFPQADPVITSTDCQHIATEAPAYTPRGSVDVQDGRFPVACQQLVQGLNVTVPVHTQVRGCPDAHSLVLRCGSDVRLRKNSW